MSIKSLEIIEGKLPAKQQKLVEAWAIIHEDELILNFENLSKENPTWKAIEPLK